MAKKKGFKSSKQMERHIKGMANHYRIDILFVLSANKKMTLEQIIAALRADEKTIGQHVRYLHRAGLVRKKYRGRHVEHTLSPYGTFFLYASLSGSAANKTH